MSFVFRFTLFVFPFLLWPGTNDVGRLNSDAMARIEATAGRVRADAVDLYRHLTVEHVGYEFEQALRDGGTNVLVTLKKPIPHGWFANVRTFSVNVFVGLDERRKIIVVRAVEDIVGGLRRECVYDETGTVAWALSFDSKSKAGTYAGKLREAFEFDHRGKLLRSWDRGADRAVVSRCVDGSFYEARGLHNERALFGALAKARSGLTLDEGSLESRMIESWSNFFESVSVTNNVSLLVKMRTWGPPVAAWQSNTWRTCSPGAVLVSAHWKKMAFRQGSRVMELSIGGKEEADRHGFTLPACFLSKTNLLYCVFLGEWSIVSPNDQKVFFPREYLMRDFRFPFHCLWKNEKDRRRWDSERCHRERLGVVLRAARREKEKGIDLYQAVVSDDEMKDLKATLRGDRCTNVVVTGGVWLTSRQLKRVTIQIGGEGQRRHVSGIFAEGDSGKGVLCSYLFDAKGRLKWAFSIIGPDSSSERIGRLDRERIFEFNENGGIHRALIPGAVLTVRGDAYDFANDEKSHRLFFDAWGQALKVANGSKGGGPR